MNPAPWNKEKLPEDLKESIIVPIYTKCDIKKVYSNYRGVSLCQVHTKCFQHLALNGNSICRGNYWGSLV
jgi:hypothetical protein